MQEQIALSLFPERQVFTVAEVNAAIRALLDDNFQDIWVSGEVSGCKTATSGHCYFTLKDRDAQITCVCYRGTLRYLRCKPQDGYAPGLPHGNSPATAMSYGQQFRGTVTNCAQTSHNPAFR